MRLLDRFAWWRPCRRGHAGPWWRADAGDTYCLSCGEMVC